MRHFIGLLLLLSWIASPPAVLAEEAASLPTEPIEITASKLISEEKKRQVVFIGDVAAVQADLALYCQRLTILYTKTGGDIDQIKATEKVRLVQGDRIATGDMGLFNQKNRTMVLRGNAQAVQGKNVIKGDVITIYLDEDRSEVQSKDGGRVRAVFFPRKATP